MGKIRTRVLGVEEVEKKQKEEQKKRAEEKKLEKKKPIEEIKIKKDTEPKKKEPKPAKDKKITKQIKGKKYQQAKKHIDAKKKFTPEEAIELLKKIKYAKFDESVELHINVDEAGLKGEVALPHAIGKSIRIAIVSDVVLEKLEKGIIEFDMLITHPSFMPRLAKFAKILGPKGLMPNPKTGTISPQPEETAKKFTEGALRWKTEAKFPLIHQMIGKLSFADKALVENIKAFINSVGIPHCKEVIVKSTMSPAIKIDTEKL